MRKVFLDNLPRSKSGKTIKWNECVGQVVKFEYDEIEGSFRILEYKTDGKNTQVNILYNNNNRWIHTKQLISGEFGLLIGAKKVVKKTGYKKYEIGDTIKNNINDLTITNHEMHKGYQFICNICGYDCSEYYKTGKYYKSYWMNLHSKRYERRMCPCCANTIVVPGKNDLATLTPETIKYFSGKTYEEKVKMASRYRPYSNLKIDIECPDCGKIHHNIMINNIQNRHFGCECRDGISYPEKFMISLLKQLNIEYKYQHRFEWCKFYNPYKRTDSYGIYDFYIAHLNLIIETDGKYGHGFINHRRDSDIFIDLKKDELAKENNLNLIRIKSYESSKEYMEKSVLNSSLVKYFDFHKVDFDVCDSYAKTNIRKQVINTYKEKNMSASELSKIFDISITTILRWFKMDGIQYVKPTLKGVNNIKNSKAIKINDKEYESVHIAEEKGIDDFGISINAQSLGNAIRAGKTYKGLNVSYI